MSLTFSLKTLSALLLIGTLIIGVGSSFALEEKSPSECDGPFKGGKKPTQEQLKQILREHGKWLKGKKKQIPSKNKMRSVSTSACFISSID